MSQPNRQVSESQSTRLNGGHWNGTMGEAPERAGGILDGHLGEDGLI